MAYTQFSASDPQTVKLWSNRIYQEFVTDTGMLAAMMDAGIVTRQEQTEHNAGDTVTVSLRQKQEGYGLIGDQPATGQENALTYFPQQVVINELRYPMQIPNTMTISQQRVVYDLPADTYRAQMDWLSERAIISALYQMAGFNPTTFTWGGKPYTGFQQLELQGLNPVSAPTSQRIFYPNGLSTELQVSTDTTATFKLSYIDQLEYMAETIQPYIRPISETSGIKYHLYVHNSIWTQMIEDTSAPIQFRDIFGSWIKDGKTTGTIARSFDYSQTRIFRSDKLPNGISAGVTLPNVRRSVFCGRDAAVMCLGRGFSGYGGIVPGFLIREDTIDIAKWRRVAISAIWGIKKTVFNGQDYGTIVIPNYTSQTYQS
jgi:hypothetical protein